MDSFDDFEMKPITDGLGFHKKAVRLNDSVEESGALKEQIETSLPKPPPEEFLSENVKSDTDTLKELLSALGPIETNLDEDNIGEASVKVSETLPRTKGISADMGMNIIEPMSPPPMVDIDTPIEPEVPVRPVVRPVIDKKIKSMDRTQRGATNSPKPKFTATPISLASVVLDGIIVFALSLIFLVSLLMVTGIDLVSVLSNSQSDLTTQISLGILYVAVLQMYVVVARSFFGKTLAEWTFDLQMGSDKDQSRATYPIKVVWRSFLVVVTGIVVIPTLSFVLRKDILSVFTGLQLYKRNY